MRKSLFIKPLDFKILTTAHLGINVFSKFRFSIPGLFAISSGLTPTSFTKKFIALIIFFSEIIIYCGCFKKAERHISLDQPHLLKILNLDSQISLFIFANTWSAKTKFDFDGSNPISLTELTASTNMECLVNAIPGKLDTNREMQP
ncbi:hypothetical protein KIW84_055399 [Lathyrus oleraceus]|uniref:Uncharacterized protein n=1 Tax=Pisum sativum TaxID=3888 RepID=A0A9D5AFR9_PEA|nr:hypothetical protein KIW84_055399 [Pisum sativum]